LVNGAGGGVGSFAVQIAKVLGAEVTAVCSASKVEMVQSVVDMLGTSQAGTHKAELYQSFNTWLQSGSTQVPSFIQSKISDRLGWQQPKAIICSVLLAIFVVVSIRIWGTLIRQSKVRQMKRKLQEKALLFSGVVAVAVCLLLMLMVIGNTQGTLAPMSLTMVYG
jgi:hypothetical protein